MTTRRKIMETLAALNRVAQEHDFADLADFNGYHQRLVESDKHRPDHG